MTEESTASQKRLRNRLSQQAFRKRQNAYIKDLERRLEIRGNEGNDQVSRLEKDNRALREQLTAACASLERVQNTLKFLSASMMSHLSSGSEADLLTPRGRITTAQNESETTNSDSMKRCADTDVPSLSLDVSQRSDDIPGLEFKASDDSTLMPLDALLPDHGDSIGPAIQGSCNPALDTDGRDESAGLDMSSFVDKFSDIRGIPGVWTHEYQMGPASFKARSLSANATALGVVTTNSAFSDHMKLIRSCLKRTWSKANQAQLTSVTPDAFRLSAAVLLSLFHSLSRPAALAWYSTTQFQDNITDLVLWQMNRSREVYARMHANYRPSALQLLGDYPSVIDWMPFPTIRDKLILMHSANPCLDRIICDIATAYVVEVDAECLVLGQSGVAYIRVWDLVCASQSGTGEFEHEYSQPDLLLDHSTSIEFAGEQRSLLPAPTLECLFQPQYARCAINQLGVNDGLPRFKLDPSLFNQYPELYDSGADIMAKGYALVPSVQTRIPGPIMPRNETMMIYQSVADCFVSTLCRATLHTPSQNEMMSFQPGHNVGC